MKYFTNFIKALSIYSVYITDSLVISKIYAKIYIIILNNNSLFYLASFFIYAGVLEVCLCQRHLGNIAD